MRRTARLVGRASVALGCLVLLFIAYEAWGTSLVESHDQARLRAELAPLLPRPHTPSSSPDASPPGGVAPGPATAPPLPAPAVGRPIGVIRIPAIGLDQAVVQGVNAPQLEEGPGHYPGTPLPGEPGNAAIAGHRTTYAHPFFSLDEVHPGDEIDVTTPQGTFVYDAIGTVVVPPTDVAVLDATTDPELTLTTCNPRYSASSRLVLRARLVRSVLAGGAEPSASRQPTSRVSTAPAPSPRAAARMFPAPSGAGSWLGALAWGLAAAAVAFGASRLAARRPRHRGWWWAAGTLPFLAALFLCFAALSPLLPAGL